VWKKAKKCMELLWLEKKIWMMTKKQFSVNIIWNEWIFEEIERSKMLGEGLWNSGESQLEWTRIFRKINLYKITAKPILLLPFQAEQIVLLFCYCIFFFRNSNSINEVLISFFFEKKMHASVPIMMLLLYLKFRDTLGNNE